MARAKSIMIQGTASGAGKSLLTAGLCRVLRQDGLRVAPFKSQNMALNSFITAEGLELGRAQAMQAEAAGIPPLVAMNPILLKPTGDKTSQVIVNGEIAGLMSAVEYFAYKRGLIPTVMEAYNTLAEEFDVIVMEGAGSPAEINLKDEDIVNMGMAKMAGAPVLLAGDIDRGGVFASLYGTTALLEEEEHRRIKGIIINKFRGDVEILRPGLEMLERLTGIPVIGTVPMLDVDLEDEDSLAPRLSRQAAAGVLDVAVLRPPRLANFTDLHALEQVEGLAVRYVTKPDALRQIPDMVVLAGSKNTMEDLLWMRQNGLEAQVKALASKGVVVVGICGGFQMLGKTLADPLGVECGGEIAGMGLLEVETVFEPQKRRARVEGMVRELEGPLAELTGKEVFGYEIHMGQTRLLEGAAPFALLGGQMPDGAYHGNIIGSYLHGLFDSAAFTQALLQILLKRKNLAPNSLRVPDYRQYREGQYNKLADALRASLDMEAVYRIIEKGA